MQHERACFRLSQAFKDSFPSRNRASFVCRQSFRGRLRYDSGEPINKWPTSLLEIPKAEQSGIHQYKHLAHTSRLRYVVVSTTYHRMSKSFNCQNGGVLPALQATDHHQLVGQRPLPTKAFHGQISAFRLVSQSRTFFSSLKQSFCH